MAAWRISTRIGTAQAAAVRERVFDFANTPAFLIEHRIIDDAADGEFRVFLDGIILEVLVAAIAIKKVSPIRIPGADSATEGHGHGGGLDIEWFVVFNDTNGLLY